MYFTELPDHTAPGFDEKAHFSRFGKQNIVFNAFSRESHCDEHVGCLSIKTVLSGQEWYGVGNQNIAVRPGQFLVLNDDQSYSCHIDKGEPTRTFSIFFQKEFAAAVFHDALLPDTALLDNPSPSGIRTPEFFQTLHPVDPHLNIKDHCPTEEHLVFLLHHLIRTYRSDAACVKHIKAVKPSTKKEIFKRLCIAKDYIHSFFEHPLHLQQLSAQACLSLPQLIRHFKSVFHQTPHQYLVTLRLRQASLWLKNTSMPVHEITWRCGFNDTSAFCRAFRSAYGLSPDRFRQS
jgi:AraC-like DNA-binding protein